MLGILIPNPSSADDFLGHYKSEKFQDGPVNLHYVRAQNPEKEHIILIHGWPQDWTAWRKIIPLLSYNYDITAIDIRGIGQSKNTAENGYDKKTLAGDIANLMEHLNMQRAHIVGHDMGGMIAYAFALLYPQKTSTVTIIDTFIPGLPGFDKIMSWRRSCHINFHSNTELAMMLIQGKQKEYFTFLMHNVLRNKGAITPEDIARYAASYESDAQLKAGFLLYKAFKEDMIFFSETKASKSDIPVLLIGGEWSMGQDMEHLKTGMEQKNFENIGLKIIDETGHWVAEEQPQILSNHLLEFFKIKN